MERFSSKLFLFFILLDDEIQGKVVTCPLLTLLVLRQSQVWWQNSAGCNYLACKHNVFIGKKLTLSYFLLRSSSGNESYCANQSLTRLFFNIKVLRLEHVSGLAGDLVETQIDGPYFWSFWFSRSGWEQVICISGKFPQHAATLRLTTGKTLS